MDGRTPSDGPKSVSGVRSPGADGSPGGEVQEVVGTRARPFWSRTRAEGGLLAADGSEVIVTAVEAECTPGGTPVYNLEVEGWHTYFVAQAAGGTSVLVHNKMCLLPKNTPSNLGKQQNFLKPDSRANGAHTTFKQNNQGKIITHEEWIPNPKNPNGFDSAKRVDAQYSSPHSHINKATKQSVPTPHVQSKSIEGGIRPASPEELPQ